MDVLWIKPLTKLQWSNNILEQSRDFMITNVCGRTLLWISIPAAAHQFLPLGRRLVASFHIFRTVAFIHPTEEKCHWTLEFSKGLLPIPHLPQH